MKIVTLVQARLGSTRLPGKVLAPIAGRPMIGHVLRRAAQGAVQDTVLATSAEPGDDALAAAVAAMGFAVRRGSLEDVLDRYYRAARDLHADVVVRVTGDCPLVDPEVLDLCLETFAAGGYDYVSNAYPAPSYPDGLDVEVVSFPALERAWREARKPSEREHVTPYVWNHPELFRLGRRAHATDLSHLRWTVDEERDLAFMREVFARIDPDAARLRDVLALLEREPELARINSGIGRNEGYRKSLRQDAAAEKRS